eukprot:2609164-Rhodomonas_salina.2
MTWSSSSWCPPARMPAETKQERLISTGDRDSVHAVSKLRFDFALYRVPLTSDMRYPKMRTAASKAYTKRMQP